MADLSIANLFSVKGKTVVITGGGSGLGEMMASGFIQNGANVIIASRKEKQLKEAADAMNAKGPGKCTYIIADVSSKAGCDKLVEQIKAQTKKVHVLINNTGVTWGAPYDNFPEEQGWDKVMAVNVKSLFYMTVGLTPLLAQGATNTSPGVVLNIASVAGLDAKAEDTSLGAKGTGLWSYNTSKAAAIHLTKTLTPTLAKQFITCNAICPGVYPSKMTKWALSQKGNQDKLAKAHPMGRIGAPEDIAGLALFLSSRAGAHISGEFIQSDGGALLSGHGYSSQSEAVPAKL